MDIVWCNYMCAELYKTQNPNDDGYYSVQQSYIFFNDLNKNNMPNPPVAMPADPTMAICPTFQEFIFWSSYW